MGGLKWPTFQALPPASMLSVCRLVCFMPSCYKANATSLRCAPWLLTFLQTSVVMQGVVPFVFILQGDGNKEVIMMMVPSSIMTLSLLMISVDATLSQSEIRQRLYASQDSLKPRVT